MKGGSIWVSGKHLGDEAREAGKGLALGSCHAPELYLLVLLTGVVQLPGEGSVRPPLVTELGPEPGAPKARPRAPPLSNFQQQQSVTQAVCPGEF